MAALRPAIYDQWPDRWWPIASPHGRFLFCNEAGGSLPACLPVANRVRLLIHLNA